MKTWLLLLVILPLLVACASNPLGMSDEQWKSLTPSERKALLLEQQKYNEQQRLQRMKADAEARQQQHEAEMAERQRINSIYQNPMHGDLVIVNLFGGEYQYGKHKKRILEDGYQLARGEIKAIKLRLKDPKKDHYSSETVYLQYTYIGNAVYLYLDNPKYNVNARIALLKNGQWRCGAHYKKDLKTSSKKLQNIKLFVKEVGSNCGHSQLIERKKIYR